MSAIQHRNAAFASTVQRKLQSTRKLCFAALEELVADLSDVVRVCDEHELEFSSFAAFDDLLFGTDGTAELDKTEEAHRLRVADDDFEVGAGLFAPLEGERGGYIHLLLANNEAGGGTSSFHVATGKYWLLFERPLPALGAFRAAWMADQTSCAAADGVAYCLCLLGLRDEASVPLAIQWWSSVQPPLRDAAAASSFLATLAHVVPEPPAELATATAILRNASRFLRTRAVAAVRKLLRQWLPPWLARKGKPPSSSAATALCLQLCEDGNHKGAPGWLGAVLRGRPRHVALSSSRSVRVACLLKRVPLCHRVNVAATFACRICRMVRDIVCSRARTSFCSSVYPHHVRCPRSIALLAIPRVARVRIASSRTRSACSLAQQRQPRAKWRLRKIPSTLRIV